MHTGAQNESEEQLVVGQVGNLRADWQSAPARRDDPPGASRAQLTNLANRVDSAAGGTEEPRKKSQKCTKRNQPNFLEVDEIE
jgi:hypothetical protein